MISALPGGHARRLQEEMTHEPAVSPQEASPCGSRPWDMRSAPTRELGHTSVALSRRR